MKRVALLSAALLGVLGLLRPLMASEPSRAEPLVIGETFTLQSKILDETRRINVYFPPGFSGDSEQALPVLYMPDGGLDGEDFLHIAGLVQISVLNGTMRPFLLVGIENTERRRDLTGPTKNAEDLKIAPRVGGSQVFRDFFRNELMPEVGRRYRTTDESAIVGESLAGLFVVETFLLEPDLFDTCISVDPSLWWSDRFLVEHEKALLAKHDRSGVTLFVAHTEASENGELSAQFAKTLDEVSPKGVRHIDLPMPGETHRTIFHPAALAAFRTVFAPPDPPK